MSYNSPTQHYGVKLPFRRSLAPNGIPDYSDVFAIYLRWVRQRHYQIHDGATHQDAPSSAVSTRSSNDALEVLNESHAQDPGAPLPNLSFDAQRLSNDLLGLDAATEGDDAQAAGYPSELELIG